MSGDVGQCSILRGILQNGSAYNYPGTDIDVVGRVLRLWRIAHWQELAISDSLWHFGKGWIVRGATTRRLPYWAKGLF